MARSVRVEGSVRRPASPSTALRAVPLPRAGRIVRPHHIPLPRASRSRRRRPPPFRPSRWRSATPRDRPRAPPGSRRAWHRRRPRSRAARRGGGWRGCAACIGSRKRIRRTTPSPPLCAPAPPEPRRIAKRSSDHREARLQHFRVGQPRIGHMGLHRARPVEIRAGPGAARDRLIILMRRVAEGEIVHRPLARRQRAASGEQAIGDHLAGLDIAGDHGGRIMRD